MSSLPKFSAWYRQTVDDLAFMMLMWLSQRHDLRDVMQDRYGVIVMRCEQTHRVSSMPKPKLRPEPDFDT